MPSIIPGYEYDIFISYRHKDNKYDGWVTEFVTNLKKELEATFKEDISIYFDTNPHDGLLETHDVDESLKQKLKCLIFIPIISQTYCDPKSFAWKNEFLAFIKMVGETSSSPFGLPAGQAGGQGAGLKVKLANNNVASRVLPIRIHEIDASDQKLLEDELQGKLRAIDFIYHSAGVNRPLTPKDERELNLNKYFYRDQINKVANSVKEITVGLQNALAQGTDADEEKQQTAPKQIQFRTELKRRNVLRASLAYVLLSLVFWKVTSISINLFSVPESALNIVTLVLIIFFPISIIMAWLYERSPQGFIRTGTTASFSNPFSPDQKKPFTSNTLILILTVTASALFLFVRPEMNGRKEEITQSPVIDPSVAVIPFEDMSPNHDQEYFSNGMMDEILNHLFKIGGLRVISRTTAMKYKGSKLSLKEIATELNVDHVLEGSVQKYGDSVRIRVQLINGKTDEHLWAGTYDKLFKDIFFIQSSVAQQVARQLKVTIAPEVIKRIESIPTENAEAYNLYLQAQSRMVGDNFEFDQAKQLLEKAISLDPDFADAYASLAGWWMQKGGHAGDLGREQVLNKALPLLAKALELDGNSVAAHVFSAWISLWYNLDFAATEMEFQAVSRLIPSGTELNWFSEYLLASGQAMKAFDLSKKSFDADKNELYNWVMMSLTYYYNDQPEKALATIERTINLYTNNSFVWLNNIRLYTYCEKYESAISLYEKENADKFYDYSGPYVSGHLGIAYYKTGKKDKALELLNKLKAMSKKSPVGSPSYFIAAVYTAMGEKDQAMQSLEKAYKDHEVEMYWLKEEPLFKPLHGEPKFEALVEKVFKSKKD